MHHDPEITNNQIVLNLVRLGNLCCHKLDIGMKHEQGLMLSTNPEAINLMAKDMMLAELQVAVEENMASI
jgi:cobalamin biosynthesis protein CbiD